MFEDYIVILPSSLGSIVTSHSIKLPRFFSVSLLTKFSVLQSDKVTQGYAWREIRSPPSAFTL